MNKSLKVIFLGSGPIAVPILHALAADPAIELLPVISQPDRPAGRKRIMTPTPLARAAEEMGIQVVKTDNVNSNEFVEYLKSLEPDMLCVVSFGQIMKTSVLEIPRICCVNVHASLLPRYRGASPVVQAILNRDDQTGVCFMQMEKGLDSGPVFRTVTLPLDGSEYADALEEKLGEIAADAAAETLCGIAEKKFKPEIQNPDLVTVCRKITKNDGMVNWNMCAEHIQAMVRAYFPWPGAVAKFITPSGAEQNMTICAAKCSDMKNIPCGKCADVNGKIIVGCGNNTALEISELIPSGGKRMTAAAFRNGMRGLLPSFINYAEL